VVVADDELHAGEAALDQVAQERRPGGGILGGEDVETEDLTVALGVHGAGHHAADLADASLLAHPDREGVEPQVGVGALVEGPRAEGGDL